MFISLSFCILLHCFYTAKIVKKLRIHQFYSLNPHFYIRSIHSPIKNTPKHQVYTLAKRFKTCFQVISLFKRPFSPPWLEPPNPQKHRSYRLFQPLSFVIRAIHSTWHECSEMMLLYREISLSWTVVYGNRSVERVKNVAFNNCFTRK
jgi:hypothetical protein